MTNKAVVWHKVYIIIFMVSDIFIIRRYSIKLKVKVQVNIFNSLNPKGKNARWQDCNTVRL